MDNLSRKNRERQRHRQEILAAAEQVFAEKGFTGATVEDVARQAEFSVGTLYNFFGSKDLLFKELVEDRFGKVFECFQEEMDNSRNAKDLIEGFIQARIEVLRRETAFVKIYLNEHLDDIFRKPDFYETYVGKFCGNLMGRLENAFKDCQKQGIFRDDMDAYDMAVALNGIIDGFMFEWSSRPEYQINEKRVHTILGIFFEGAMRR